MRILLDTNIIIHREASRVINQDIGQLFNWLDRLKHTKCVHPLTADELAKYQDQKTVDTMHIKLSSYQILKTEAPIHQDVQKVMDDHDSSDNDLLDSKLLNELYANRVDGLITEDKKIHKKAALLGIQDRVFNIDQFLEKSINENPALIDYKVLSVKKEFFGNLDIGDPFFDTFKEDYRGFENWFAKKSDNVAYVCWYKGQIGAFLYLKIEDENENYREITPQFSPKKRLKIGTLKVTLNGLRIGERFLKIVFDNALKQKVDEIYVTIFDKRLGQKMLIRLLEDFGFDYFGEKEIATGTELVYVRDFKKYGDKNYPRKTFPFLPKDSNVYFVSIYPEYHTELFPDSILKNESPDDFVENEPHRNAISKVYISHAIERTLKTGDVLLFYRTGGYYKGVATTVAIVESVIDNIQSEAELIKICQKRTVLSKEELKKFWNYKPKWKPFVINLLYSYSIKHRPNLKRLIELGVIKGTDQMPRGFGKITWDDLVKVLKNKP